jgi:hypothetical protein
MSGEASDEASLSAVADTVERDPASGRKQIHIANEPNRFRLGALLGSALAAPQNVPSAAPLGAEAQKCAALMQVNIEDAPGGPSEITSARIVDVPGTGLEEMARFPGGFGSSSILRTSRIHQYCDVTGYVAPQNKFELKLPLPNDWNQRFLFVACGGFCGHVDGAAGNLGLARGFASVTGRPR